MGFFAERKSFHIAKKQTPSAGEANSLYNEKRYCICKDIKGE
jgi:hypothetical protein